jgi:hypothetical protein
MLFFSPWKGLPLGSPVLSDHVPVLCSAPSDIWCPQSTGAQSLPHRAEAAFSDLSPSGGNHISISSAFHLPPSPSTWLLSPSWLTRSVFSHQRRPLPRGSAGELAAGRSQASPTPVTTAQGSYLVHRACPGNFLCIKYVFTSYWLIE